MRVIEQARLWFREGTSDKVYEVDLVEVAANQYMVNFRFGRRGSGLRDGTKTAMPVSRDKAKGIFDQLVAEKTAAGYRATDATSTASAPKTSAAPATPRGDSAEIVRRLQLGFRDGSPVSAVWRATARDLKDAEPALLELLQAARTSKLPVQKPTKEGWMHLLVAALVRCGTTASLPLLDQLVRDANVPSYVRDVARLAIARIAPERVNELVRTLLPVEVLTPLEHGDATATARACEQVLATQPNRATNVVVGLSLLEDDDVARAALLAIARVVRLDRNAEASAARALFKLAELDRDGTRWIAIARRIDAHEGWQRPFGPKTRNYFRRRTARVLRRLAQAESRDYVVMATEVLLAYTDADAKQPIHSNQSGRWFGGFAGDHVLNDIIYSERSPYERSSYNRSAWSTRKEVPPDKVRARMGREERYPALWDEQPAAIWRVLRDGRATPVVEFAVFAIRANRAYADTLPDEEIARVLGAGHRLAQPVAFEIAQVRPMSTPLARGALASDVADAQAWVLRWLQTNTATAAGDPEMIALLVTGKTAAIREAAQTLGTIAPDVMRSAAARALSIMIGFRETESERATSAIATIVAVVGDALRELSPEVLRDMIGHPLSAIGELAGELMLRHARRDTLPASLVELLLASPHPRVRAYGGKVLATTPPEIAKDDPDALILFATSTNAELREHTRSLVGAVATQYPDVGRILADKLVDMLMKPLPDGAPAHIVSLLRAELAGVLPQRPAQTILAMTRALSPHAREAGGLLLPQLGPDDLELEDIVRLAQHEILAIRQGAWALARSAIARFRLAQSAIGRLVDSQWEDTRAFAMRFVDEVGALSADAIIAICDSIRPEVQELGKRLLHERFQTSDAGKYVVRLAEHPSQNIQLLVSSMLEAHVAADLERVRVLAPYLVTVLSQVNRGKIAKERVIALLRKIATHSHEHAAVVAPILERQSATIAVTQKHPLIATMVDVKETFPDVPLPITVVPPRSAS
jgi:hypothetical protein